MPILIHGRGGVDVGPYSYCRIFGKRENDDINVVLIASMHDDQGFSPVANTAARASMNVAT
jgi:hypothetical protein